eukprot:766377-Hanusia_phi.AAC.7
MPKAHEKQVQLSSQRLLRTRTSIVQENAPEDGATLLMTSQSSTEKVSEVDEWWNSTLPKKTSKQDLFLWQKEDVFVPAEHEKLVRKREKHYRADALMTEEEDRSLTVCCLALKVASSFRAGSPDLRRIHLGL